MEIIHIDAYVLDVLMRDLIGHDSAPCTFFVYLWLWTACERRASRSIPASYQTIASGTGLSKTSVQKGIAHLLRRRLITVTRKSPTATPAYALHRHWRRRKARAQAPD
jgi:hypothetical protein